MLITPSLCWPDFIATFADCHSFPGTFTGLLLEINSVIISQETIVTKPSDEGWVRSQVLTWFPLSPLNLNSANIQITLEHLKEFKSN